MAGFGRRADAPNGQSLMFASALKMMGLDPAVVEKLSTGLLHDLTIIAKHVGPNGRMDMLMVEILARQEYLMRCTPPMEGDTENLSSWEAYMKERQAEHERNSRGVTGPAIGAVPATRPSDGAPG